MNSRGSVLLEVAVATVLVALLVVPLAEALRTAVAQARTLREHAAVVSYPGSVPSPDDDPWSWGPRVVDAWWRPGPVLHVRLETPGGETEEATLTLGLWVDGWNMEGGTLTSTWAAIGDQSIWQGRQGCELVVRARTGRGGWGPPWRTQVPGDDGDLPAGEAVVTGGQEDRAWLDDDPAVVVHMASAGIAAPAACLAGAAAEPLPSAGPFLFPPAGTGWWNGQTGGRSQWWRLEPGRGLDVYF